MKAELNKHYWVITKELNPKLMVVLCTSEKGSGYPAEYAVCGFWEGPISDKDFTIIKEIKPPAGHGHVQLYYYREPE